MQLISTNGVASLFLVAETDRGFSLFQVSNGKIQKLANPVDQGTVLCFDVSRNGTHFLAAGEDGYLRFYLASDLSLIRSLRASATSLHVARFATDTLIFCSSSDRVEVWDLQKTSAEPILYLESKPTEGAKSTLKEHTLSFIWDICIHPDQPFICAAVDSEGNFSIWDLRRNKLAQLFSSYSQDSKSEPIQYPLYTTKELHKGNILKASFIVSDPNYIVTCGEDGSLQLLNLALLDLNPTLIENLQTERSVMTKKLISRNTSISDFCINGDVIFTANDDESISAKTILDF